MEVLNENVTNNVGTKYALDYCYQRHFLGIPKKLVCYLFVSLFFCWHVCLCGKFILSVCLSICHSVRMGIPDFFNSLLVFVWFFSIQLEGVMDKTHGVRFSKSQGFLINNIAQINRWIIFIFGIWMEIDDLTVLMKLFSHANPRNPNPICGKIATIFD